MQNAQGKRLGEAELGAIVAREIALAEESRAAASAKQARALEYFQGVMKDLPAETGRSRAVSRDLADTMGWLLPGIMRVFTASEQMAVAEPVGRDDVDNARQATDALNHVFWKENDGYRVVHAATWDSLLAGNGIVKSWHDDTPVSEVSFHSGLSDDQFTELVSDEGIEVLNHSTAMEQQLDPATGGLAEVQCHAVKIRRVKRKGRTRCEAIAPEDYGKDADSKTCAEARFQYQRADKTRSELIEMGFERALVEGLERSSASGAAERLARGDFSALHDDADASMEIVDLYECYLKLDVDGDGIAETCRIYYAGNSGGGTILDWEEWEDETPFDDIPCEPMPHRWEAGSIADETMDVQQIKTVLIRQALDNTYATNNPQRFVTGTIKNPDELFSPSFGGAIFGEANATVQNLTVPFVAQYAYEGINYQDQVIQRRTGVARQTMALDPDALQNQTATASQNERDANYSQIELIARNQAELGWKKVFRKLLRLEIKHQDHPRDIRMRGKFVTIDPRQWNADMDISINVGLGTGSRDRDMLMLREIKGDQVMLIQALKQGGFPDKALDMVPFVLNTLNRTAEAAGIKAPEMFFPEVSADEIAAGKQRIAEMQGRPDPKTAVEQQRLQAEIAKGQATLQMDQQKSAAQLQMEQQKDAARMQMAREAAAAELQLQREKMALEAEIRREQLQAEIALKREQLAAELGLKERLAVMGAAGGGEGAAVSDVRVGGEPG